MQRRKLSLMRLQGFFIIISKMTLAMCSTSILRAKVDLLQLKIHLRSSKCMSYTPYRRKRSLEWDSCYYSTTLEHYFEMLLSAPKDDFFSHVVATIIFLKQFVTDILLDGLTLSVTNRTVENKI